MNEHPEQHNVVLAVEGVPTLTARYAFCMNCAWRTPPGLSAATVIGEAQAHDSATQAQKAAQSAVQHPPDAETEAWDG